MSAWWIVALVFGTGLVFPLAGAMVVTVRAFITSPMVALTTASKRSAALWTIGVAVVYVQVCGYALLAKAPPAVATPAAFVLLVVFGVGPFVWWFVSRQAHALFDPNTFVPAFTITWPIKRAVAQYLRAQPESELGVSVTGRDLVIAWLTHRQTVRFTFGSRGQAARLWARIYALSPDTDQVSQLMFQRKQGDDRPRAKLFLTN